MTALRQEACLPVAVLGPVDFFGVLAGGEGAFVGLFHSLRIAGGGKGVGCKLLMGLRNCGGERRGLVLRDSAPHSLK